MAELARIGVGKRVLVLGLVQPPADRDVLRRLHIKSDALDLGEPLLQAQDDLVRAGVTLAFGFELDEHTAGVGRVVAAAGADAGADRGDRGILQHGVDQRLLPLGHGLIGNVLRGLGKAEDQSGVLLRKEAFGDDDIKASRQYDGTEHHHERDEVMPQHHLQSGLIEIEKSVEAAFEQAVDTAMLLARRLEQAGAHHRGERQCDH